MRIFWESFSPRSCLWLHGLDKCKWVRVPPTRSSSLWQWPLKPDDGACNRTPDNRAAEKKEYQEYPGPFQHGMWLLRLLALDRLGEGEGATGGPRCCPKKRRSTPRWMHLSQRIRPWIERNLNASDASHLDALPLPQYQQESHLIKKKNRRPHQLTFSSGNWEE